MNFVFVFLPRPNMRIPTSVFPPAIACKAFENIPQNGYVVFFQTDDQKKKTFFVSAFLEISP